MAARTEYDAIIVGAGPNGLAAAITIARAGCSVLVLEASETVGGGARSGEITLPGFRHDICSAIHPLGVGSPFFRSLSLAEYGLKWVYSPVPLAHPLDDGTAVVLERSVEEAAAGLGRDARAYERLMGPIVRGADALMPDILGPLRIPRHPLLLVRFGLRAMQSARGLAERIFTTERASALFAGLSAHSMIPLEYAFSASFGMVLGILGHSVGWPLPRGGSQSISNALAGYLRAIGGEIVTGRRVDSLRELPSSRAVLCDVTPRQLIRLAGDRLPPGYIRRLARYRYGPAVFKVDYALNGPIPWRAPECTRAATVHLGGTLPEIAQSEQDAWTGVHTERPFTLVAQQSLFDPSRAPAGKQTAWAYCHAPHGSDFDMTDRLEAQIERFAPGFKDQVLARSVMTASDFEAYNANDVGGDIAGGASDMLQLFTRPTARIVPYSTPDPALFICSASTPPGAGVHGMSGYFAALAALKSVL
ncbi:MAG TPA: NAD(P)/FAD-dependent oxidoreductase [Armatimonadota bacterium]|nr:NAD(P)/FAD-dependent oxidoreductase [Armatimonadota bacterium]